MERLTEEDWKERFDRKYLDINYAKLAAYEDTGLTPEEIENLKNTVKVAQKYNLELRDEIHRLERKLKVYEDAEEQGLLIKKDCTGCKRILYNNGDCNICARNAVDFYEAAEEALHKGAKD
jgi:hypothetical protein